MDDKPLGPNAKNLLAHLIALEAVPPGGGIQNGLDFLTNPELRKQVAEKAIQKLKEIAKVVKSAPDNPYGDDDEAIFAAVLQKIENERKKG